VWIASPVGGLPDDLASLASDLAKRVPPRWTRPANEAELRATRAARGPFSPTRLSHRRQAQRSPHAQGTRQLAGHDRQLGRQTTQVLDALSSAGVRFWVAGSWGVDALAGEQTRDAVALLLGTDETLARAPGRIDANQAPGLAVVVTNDHARMPLPPDERFEIFDRSTWNPGYAQLHDDNAWWRATQPDAGSPAWQQAHGGLTVTLQRRPRPSRAKRAGRSLLAMGSGSASRRVILGTLAAITLAAPRLVRADRGCQVRTT